MTNNSHGRRVYVKKIASKICITYIFVALSVPRCASGTHGKWSRVRLCHTLQSGCVVWHPQVKRVILYNLLLSQCKSACLCFDVILQEIVFYLPPALFHRCGHCKRLAPEFDTAAASLKKFDPPVALAKVWQASFYHFIDLIILFSFIYICGKCLTFTCTNTWILSSDEGFKPKHKFVII